MSVGISGLLTYVLGSDERSDAGSTVVSAAGAGNTSLVLRQLRDAGMCGAQIAFDWHIAPTANNYDTARASVNYSNLRALQVLLDKEGCNGASVMVLETNECQSGEKMSRALADASSMIGYSHFLKPARNLLSIFIHTVIHTSTLHNSRDNHMHTVSYDQARRRLRRYCWGTRPARLSARPLISTDVARAICCRHQT